MTDHDQSTDVEAKQRPFTDFEPKMLPENSPAFYENREYKSTNSEKCRSHQTLSFKRNLLDREFNAAQGDSGTKKCTEDLIDLFERKSNATNALPASSDAADSPRKKDVVPDQKEPSIEKKSRLAMILAETEEDSPPTVESGAEDLNKGDEFSFDYESTEDTIDKVDSSFETEDKLSENVYDEPAYVDIDKSESISEKIAVHQALFADNASIGSEVIPQQNLQDLQSIETYTNDEVTNNFMNRIKNLKQTMDEINSMIAIEKDFILQEKLELDNSLSMVPFENGSDLAAHNSRRVFEEMRQKERKLKLSFQMKQLEEAQRLCSSELQLMSNTANQVSQLNEDMAVFSLEDLRYTTVKDNNYSLSYRSQRTPNLSPRNSPRRSISPEKNTHGSILSSYASSENLMSFDGSLMSPIEFTMGDPRLQMQAADHFKMKLCQLEAQLNSDSFQIPPKLYSARSSGRFSPPPKMKATPMKALI